MEMAWPALIKCQGSPKPRHNRPRASKDDDHESVSKGKIGKNMNMRIGK